MSARAPGAGGGVCVHHLVEATAARCPDAVAVIHGAHEVTYAALNEEANRLARRLRRLGLGPEQLVAIVLDRGVDMVVAMLATLKSGAGYVALNPAHPPDRLAGIVADSGARAILTQANSVEHLPEHGNVLSLDAERPSLASEAGTDLGVSVHARNVACVVYTSGSTGQPKGVAIEHRCVTNLILWAGTAFDCADLALVLAGSPISCDCALFEVLTPLGLGGGVLLAASPLELPTLPAADRVTLLPVPATTMSELLRTSAIPGSVRVVNLSGETLSRELVDEVFRTTSADRVFNLYGVSEAAMYSTCAMLPRVAAGPVSAGGPITATSLHVLDADLEEVPPGDVGELCIGGVGVARGYIGQPALTAERFVAHARARPGGRLYRTGDLAERLPDGTVRVLGRLDHQVKVRGFRVELGEVESGLRALAEVHDAVVMAHRDECQGARLVAYVIPTTGVSDDFDPRALRARVAQKLPPEMVPSAIVRMARFPTAPNGKVDRKALPPPGQPDEDRPAVPSGDPLECELQQIWGEVLGTVSPDVEADFLDLGGDSLLAARVVSRLLDRFGRSLTVRAVFEARTIAGLADRLREALAEPARELPRLVALPRGAQRSSD
jgi:amino acid adenylation domain-containing protein